MPSPKSDTSSHSSSDDHCFDGPDEYEVEYDEERAAVAEPTSDVDCNHRNTRTRMRGLLFSHSLDS